MSNAKTRHVGRPSFVQTTISGRFSFPRFSPTVGACFNYKGEDCGFRHWNEYAGDVPPGSGRDQFLSDR